MVGVDRGRAESGMRDGEPASEVRVRLCRLRLGVVNGLALYCGNSFEDSMLMEGDAVEDDGALEGRESLLRLRGSGLLASFPVPGTGSFKAFRDFDDERLVDRACAGRADVLAETGNNSLIFGGDRSKSSAFRSASSVTSGSCIGNVGKDICPGVKSRACMHLTNLSE